jgi:hypothetical protein
MGFMMKENKEHQELFLPTKMNLSDREILEKMGIKFSKMVDKNRLFQHVTLPKNWKKISTNNKCYYLLDDKDRKLAKIELSYNNIISLSINRRYNYHFDYPSYEKEQAYIMNITDGENIIIHTIELDDQSFSFNEREIISELESLSIAWLNARYPNWTNNRAYWD